MNANLFLDWEFDAETELFVLFKETLYNNFIVDLIFAISANIDALNNIIFEGILLISFINFLIIGLALFLQNWELLLTYVSLYNNKNTIYTKNKSLFIQLSKSLNKHTLIFAVYYL